MGKSGYTAIVLLVAAGALIWWANPWRTRKWINLP
jgi:hypothetical protein